MVNVELLKKLAFIADLAQKFEPFNFENYQIRINTLLENFKEVEYAFQVLKIPFTEYEPVRNNVPKEINVSFGFEVEISVVFLITYVLKEVFGHNLIIYINFSIEPEGKEKDIVIGTYITSDKNFTNVSLPISSFDVLRLDIKNIDLEEFRILFPNNNYSDDGTCGYQLEDCDSDADYKDYRYGSSYGKYGGYNDWSDDVIDDAFDGDPMNTWNVD